MQKDALKILREIESRGYEAYIVGGFVRDYCMNKKSLDVDICTNAKPKELSEIFEGAIIPTEKYGSVTLIFNGIRYEITTYRKDIRYDDYRRPTEIEYIDNLLEDIKRRDFTVNTLCMDSKGNVIDLLNGKKDLNNRVIRTVGDPKEVLKQDVLRILRAIRFATTLDFKISEDVKKVIVEDGYLLKNLSYTRKKEELTKIFTSPNANYGISLLMELNLDKHLELSNIASVKVVHDILGIWAQLDILDIYPFSNVERETISMVQEVLSKGEVDKYNLYRYGLYVMSIVASVKEVDKKTLNKMYTSLPIKSRGEIKINIGKLCGQLNIKPGHWLKKIYTSVEREIIDGKLKNEENYVHEYIVKVITQNYWQNK